jgi:hypothetical protein
MRTFYELSDIYCPLVVRLLARQRNGPPLSTLEIATRSGLTPHQVEALSWSTNWRGVDLDTMRRFLTGCGVNFCSRKDMKRVTEYIRVQVKLAKMNRSNYRYLRRSPDWKSLYEPMFLRLQKGTV